MNTVVYSGWLPAAIILSDFLGDVLDSDVTADRNPNCHTHGRIWPPKSRDSNPCAFRLLGFMNENLFPEKPASLMELRAMLSWCLTV